MHSVSAAELYSIIACFLATDSDELANSEVTDTPVTVNYDKIELPLQKVDQSDGGKFLFFSVCGTRTI